MGFQLVNKLGCSLLRTLAGHHRQMAPLLRAELAHHLAGMIDHVKPLVFLPDRIGAALHQSNVKLVREQPLDRCGDNPIDFGELLSPEVRDSHPHTTYDLIANTVHDGEPGPGKGSFRTHILHKVCSL